MLATVLILALCSYSVESSYYVTITDNSPAVVGATVTLVADLFVIDGTKPSSGTFKFMWTDNAIPPHTYETEGSMTSSTWNLTYAKGLYSPGIYEVEVRVRRNYWVWIDCASERKRINVTNLLNGQMKLVQNGTVRNDYVSYSNSVNHQIALSSSDQSLLVDNQTSITVYWFVDCVYYGLTNNLNFSLNYTGDVGKRHSVKAFVVISNVDENSTLTNEIQPTKVSGNLTTNETGVVSTTPTPITTTPFPVDYCLNSTIIPQDPNKTYGYFQSSFSVIKPVEKVNVVGTNWLQDGAVFNVTVFWEGTIPFWYCVRYYDGEYNVTGKEICPKAYQISSYNLSVVHYFKTPTLYTMVFILNNHVSKSINPVRITIYEVQKHAQLSVIVVPVVFMLVALILIVFGIAYYIQSRNRYTVEVADFDFSQTNDTEYKTFRERLRDAVSNAFNKTQDYVEDTGGVWSPSRKYGSMQ